MRTLYSGLLLALLVGCVSHRVDEVAPANASIAGVWELNQALSPDDAKVLAGLQPKPKKGHGRGPGGELGGPPPNGSGPDKPAPEVINDPTTDLPPIDTTGGGRYGGGSEYAAYARNAREMYRPPLDFQTNELIGGQWLKITQSESEVRIVNAARSHTYTPGEKSVVSVPSGVADQIAGWKGRSFKVFLDPQIGPAVEETYTVSPDGRQLFVKIDVASEGRNQALRIVRTYDRSTRDPAQLRQTLQETLPPTN